MSHRISFEPAAWQQLCDLRRRDHRLGLKVDLLIIAIQRDPRQGEGKPERLRGDYADHWSRRIDQRNRLIYRILDDTVVIAEIGGHYDD